MTLCLLISKCTAQTKHIVEGTDSPGSTRYQVEGDEEVWKDAEEQVKKGKGSNVVSVKSGKQKRKAGQTAEEVYNEAFGEKKHKKHKKPKK